MKKLILILTMSCQIAYAYEEKVEGCSFDSYRKAIDLLEEYEQNIIAQCPRHNPPRFQFYDRGEIKITEGNFPCELTISARMECVFVGW